MEISKERSSYWDNVKAVLIFLVVLAHYFGYGFVYGETSDGLWDLPNGIYGFIYMFHMPLFAFVSGLFSKNLEKARDTAFSRLLLPYVLFNALCVLMNRLLWHVPLTNPVFDPYNHMWYLFALFLWRYTARDVCKIRWSWLWALVFSVFCAAFTPGMDWLLISRAILFWPFFLLGVTLSTEQAQRVRRLPKLLCAAVLLLALAAAVALRHYDLCTTFQLCFIPRTFAHNLSGLPELCVLLLRYLVAFVLGVCVLNLVPDKACRFTRIGQNTLVILLLHSLPGLRNLMNALNPFPENVPWTMLWCTIWAVLATLLFGNRYVTRAYQALMDRIAGLFPRAIRK